MRGWFGGTEPAPMFQMLSPIQPLIAMGLFLFAEEILWRAKQKINIYFYIEYSKRVLPLVPSVNPNVPLILSDGLIFSGLRYQE